MSDSPAASIDFYTFIHKSLRRRMFRVGTSAASADFTDDDALAALADELDALGASLRAHAEHEKKFLYPLLAKHLADAETKLSVAHAKQDVWLDSIARSFAQARQQRSPELGAAFCRELNRFIGDYLLHLADEEQLNAEIWARVPAEDLTAAMAAFQSSRPPEEAARDLEAMLPALNRQDRAAIMNRLRAVPPAFALVREIARHVLDTTSFEALEADVPDDTAPTRRGAPN